MHTLIVTGFGLLLLGVFLAAGGANRPAIAYGFIALWAVLCILHLSFGVVARGYGLREELAIHIIVFGLPAALALMVALRMHPTA